jgi:alcohol dehydrogenase class IV
MVFKMSSTPNIVFGANKLKILPQLIAEYGNKVILVTGKSSFLKSFVAIDLLQDIEYVNIETKLVHISGEPSPETIDKVVNEFRNWNANVVVAIGGGSVLDAGKAISAMLCEEGNTKDYLEGIGTKVLSGKKIL